MTLAQKIKEYRVFSISFAVFLAYILVQVLDWIYQINTSDVTTQQVTLATAVLVNITALVKFCFSFAMGKSNGEHEKQ